MAPPHYYLSGTAVALSPVAEPSYSVEEYTDDRLTKYTVWKEVGQTTKLLEVTYTYVGDDLSTETVRVYNDGTQIGDPWVYDYAYAVSVPGPPVVRTVTRDLQ